MSGGMAGRSVGAARASGEALKLSQFAPVEELGVGAFGVVKKVRHTASGEYFAMKVMDKKQVTEKGLQEQLHREVLMQGRIRHPHVVSLLYYFEDKFRIYCLLEYADQGNLFSYLRDQVHGLKEPRAGMFFTDTARGVEHLHSQSVVHRDMKPENILLFGKDLRAKLADFGWCVELTPEEPERTTFCGTIDYIPPEMMLSEHHGLSVDIWALGVLLYEMLQATAPFAAASQKSAFDLITAVKYKIPAGSMSPGAEDLIRKLLLREKAARLPIQQVLRHPWVVTYGGSDTNSGCSKSVAADPENLDKTVIHPRHTKPLNDQDAMDRTMIVKRPPPPAAAVSARSAEPPAFGSKGYTSIQKPDKAFAVENLDGTCIVPRRPAVTAPQPPGTVLNLHSSAGQQLPVAAENLDGTCIVPRRPSPPAAAASPPVVPAEIPGTVMGLHSAPWQPPPVPKELPFLLSTALQQDGKKGWMPESIPEDLPFSDSDLLSSVPDERIDIDELSDLFTAESASPQAKETSCKQKEEEREFGIDGTRRRTPMVKVSRDATPPRPGRDATPPRKGRDATPPRKGRDATPPRLAPGRVMEGGAPMAKRLSRRK